MPSSNAGPRAPTSSDYVLVAVVNTSRASAVRNLALEFCPTVVLVRDGQEAIEHMDEVGPPRLLITELSLPRVDGFGVLRHLRRLAPVSRAGAIVVSPHESFRNAARKLTDSLGITKILPADIDRPPLRRAIASVVSRPSVTPQTKRQPSLQTSTIEARSFDDVIKHALFELTRQFCVPVGAAYLTIRDERRFEAYMSTLDPSRSLDWSKVSELLPQAAAGDDPLVVPDLEGHPLFGHVAGFSSIRGFAGVPLTSPGGVSLGALGVFDTNPLALTTSDLDTLAAFALDTARELSQIITATSEAEGPTDKDIEALEQLAATDPLTGLANRRGCEKGIAREISRAQREHRPLSCILLDIDRFKQVNDTLGHHAGDQVLRELSSLLRRSVRAYDIVARWGGEEFLLVLPGADRTMARILAERIRVGIQQLPVSNIGSITVSAGAAEFDSDYDFDSTLRVADRRLYEAKAAGRNTVV
jgi:diguanylate cyclase (GGDEF)-like protein